MFFKGIFAVIIACVGFNASAYDFYTSKDNCEAAVHAGRAVDYTPVGVALNRAALHKEKQSFRSETWACMALRVQDGTSKIVAKQTGSEFLGDKVDQGFVPTHLAACGNKIEWLTWVRPEERSPAVAVAPAPMAAPQALLQPAAPAPQAQQVAQAVGPIPVPAGRVRNILVTFHARCIIWNTEGHVLAYRYTASDEACDAFEANFRASVADPDALISRLEYPSGNVRQAAGSPVTTATPSTQAGPQLISGQRPPICPPGKVYGEIVVDGIADQNGRSMKGQKICTEPGNPAIRVIPMT